MPSAQNTSASSARRASSRTKAIERLLPRSSRAYPTRQYFSDTRDTNYGCFCLESATSQDCYLGLGGRSNHPIAGISIPDRENQPMRFTSLGLAACLAASLSGTCLAQDLKGAPRFGETQVGFAPTATYTNYTLTVSGPNGFYRRHAGGRDVPTLD